MYETRKATNLKYPAKLLVTLKRDESLNTACSPGLPGGDIVGSDTGSGATRGAKFAKRAASKNNCREGTCNKLVVGRLIEMASDGGAGPVIVSKISGKPVIAQVADIGSVHMLGANELMENCMFIVELLRNPSEGTAAALDSHQLVVVSARKSIFITQLSSCNPKEEIKLTIMTSTTCSCAVRTTL
uniref:Uncharacterized protein n=1 Tax=Glossina pallidipes TaxID=7398 RepID=A0A1A9ZHI2_GLOPL